MASGPVLGPYRHHNYPSATCNPSDPDGLGDQDYVDKAQWISGYRCSGAGQSYLIALISFESSVRLRRDGSL